MYKKSEIAIAVNDEGVDVLELEVSSNTLPGVTVDTYQTFTGDSSDQNFLDYQSEQGEPSDYDDYDWDYDNAAVHRELAEASIEAIIAQLGGKGVIESIELTSTWSPKEYNFKTDSYNALYTIDPAKLEEWADENFKLEEYLKEYHQSYDGYADFVGMYLEDPETQWGTLIWLKLAAYVRAELDGEAYMNYMCEREGEIWSNNTTVTPRNKD